MSKRDDEIPSYEEACAELRAAGLDPVEVGKKGAAIAEAGLAKRRIIGRVLGMLRKADDVELSEGMSDDELAVIRGVARDPVLLAAVNRLAAELKGQR
jgi:hypothetical protein